MIPGLRRIVEYGGVVRFTGCGLDDFIERHIGKFGAEDQLVERPAIRLLTELGRNTLPDFPSGRGGKDLTNNWTHT